MLKVDWTETILRFQLFLISIINLETTENLSI